MVESRPRRRRRDAESPAPEPEAVMAALRQELGAAPAPEPVAEPLRLEAREVPLAAIDAHAPNVRRVDPAEVEELKASLAKFGLLEPVIIQPIPGKRQGFRYRLVAGFRRVAAAKALGWETIPARVLDRPLAEDERIAVQLTENLQREGMRLRDTVAAVRALRGEGRSAAQVAAALGIGETTARLYLQVGDLLEKYPKLWTYFDQGLLNLEHFRTAMRLLSRVRQQAKEQKLDAARQVTVAEQAERLFVALLDRLARIQPLTARRVSLEVAEWLRRIGIEEPEPTADAQKAPAAPPPLLVRPVLAGYRQLDLTRLSDAELEEFITVSEARLDAARAELARRAER
ncbi:MAG: ParB N-terminal domain-containing protein [Firmicutes bacterium]|nr:ParB N-terminal domain-containing protein [Bacillota bacterium]